MKIKKSKIPTILGMIILIVGVGAGVFLVQSRQLLKIGASPEIAPQDLRMVNISDSSFTVWYITDKETVGAVLWGEGKNLDNTVPSGTEANTAHLVTIRGLSANTNYSFKIASDGKEFDNNGIAWEVTTGSDLGIPLDTQVISGSVKDGAGTAVAGALVSVSSSNISPLATKTSPNGTWVIPISTARTKDGSAYAVLADDSELEILVQAEGQMSTAQTKLSLANPVRPIVLGQVHDFRNEEPLSSGGLPSSSIDLPEDASPSSKFSLPDTSEAPTDTTSVSLSSHDEGEVISTQKPEFFGVGPTGTELTITVESDIPYEGQVTIDSAGEWQWSPPDNLEPGSHTITINWTDTNGVLRTLTRNFIVQAADNPSFESTPSGETPTPTPTTTASPTPTASPSPTASATATPRVSIPSTESAVPESGTIAPTYALLIMSTGLILGAILIFKESLN